MFKGALAFQIDNSVASVESFCLIPLGKRLTSVVDCMAVAGAQGNVGSFR
jgi:hypothetical protein